MNDADLMREELVDERVHGEHVAWLSRQWLKFERTDDSPPLSVVRTTLPEGPSRPPVVLVHGLAQNRYTWRVSGRSLVAHLAEQGYEVLNLELRGHGLSRSYGAGNATSFAEYVADAVRVIEACEQPPFMIGHSLGGGVIVGAATEAPVAGLIPMAGVFSFGRHNVVIRAAARLSLRAEPFLLAAPARVSTQWIGVVLGAAYSLTDIAGYGLPLAGWVPGSIERDLLEERLAKGFDWTSIEVWLQMSRWARGEPFAYAEAFTSLDVPLYVLCGDSDPLLPRPDAQACFDGSGSTDKRFECMELYEHGQHFGHVDLILGRHAPELVWSRMSEWLSARC